MSEAPPKPSFLQRAVRRAIEEAGESRDHYDRLISKRTGKTGKTLHDIERGKNRKPSADTLKLIAEVLGKPLSYFMEGQVVPAAATPDQPPTRHASAGDDMVEITALDLSFPMGSGANIDDYIEETPVKFDLSYIRQFAVRTAPSKLRLARGVGESMFPTLLNNDAVWIDTSRRILNEQDRIWAVSIFGAAAIKRLRTIGDGKVLVISDNPTVENQVVEADDLLIGGRIIRLERDI